jgi:hypothetical protein
MSSGASQILSKAGLLHLVRRLVRPFMISSCWVGGNGGVADSRAWLDGALCEACERFLALQGAGHCAGAEL